MKKLTSILFLITMLAACSDKDDKTPEYKIPEGLHVTTYYDAYNCQYVYSSDTRYWDQIIFYSETFPVMSLIGATVTCHLLEEYPHFNLLKEYPEPIPCLSLILHEKDFLTTKREYTSGLPILPGCGNEGNMCSVYLQIPPDYGDYHMYFTFENPENGICYKTPILRYSYVSNMANFATTISPLN